MSRRAEAGGVSTFVVVMTMPMVLMAALAFDGGQMLAARRHAADLAGNAALAGAQAIDAAAVRSGGLDVDPDLVQRAAQDHLARHGATGTVTVLPNEVVVTVTDTVELTLLPVVGVTSRPVSGVGRAQLLRGVEAADASPTP